MGINVTHLGLLPQLWCDLKKTTTQFSWEDFLRQVAFAATGCQNFLRIRIKKKKPETIEVLMLSI